PRLGRQRTPTGLLARDHGRRQVSWLAGLHLPPPSRDPSSQWRTDGRFAAYSCRGFGAKLSPSPRSLLIPDGGTVEARLESDNQMCQAYALLKRRIGKKPAHCCIGATPFSAPAGVRGEIS